MIMAMLTSSPAHAGQRVDGPACTALAMANSAIVDEVIDGDTVVLRGGRQVRLVGTQAPKLPLGRPGFAKWPLADEARARLQELVLGRSVQLAYGGLRRDRHGRQLAHLFLNDHADHGDRGPARLWVQGTMVGDGLARVYSFSDNRACVAELLALEARARAAKRGIWALPYYAIGSAARPGALARLAGTFQIVEGRARLATRRGRWIYINFGSEYWRDFTIAIPSRSWKLFSKAGFSLAALPGQRLRVRGWLELRGGPMIEADHPEQIERLPK